MHVSICIEYTIKVNWEPVSQEMCSDINGSLNEQSDAYPVTSGTNLCDLKAGKSLYTIQFSVAWMCMLVRISASC